MSRPRAAKGPGDVVPRAPRLDVRDFDTTIESPFDSNHQWLLSFGAAHRKAWALLPDIEIDRGAEEEEEEEHERDRRRLRYALSVAFGIGRVRCTRRLVRGGEDDLGGCELTLHVESEPSFTEVRAHRRKGPHEPMPWAPALTEAFHAILTALVEAAPFPALEMLKPAPPELTADALVREGWARRGAEVGLRALDEYWNPNTPLDVKRLLGEIDADREKPPDDDGRRGVVRHGDSSLRLVHPLFAEVACVELPWRTAPLWHAARFWLAVDIDAKGELESMTIRTDRDGTWDTEGDDDGDDSLFHDRLDEAAYGPASWITEEFTRDPNDPEADEDPSVPDAREAAG